MREKMAHRQEAYSPKLGAYLASDLAKTASGLAVQEAQPGLERLEKPLWAMHQQMDELVVEMRSLRGDLGEFLEAHRKTLRVLLGQDPGEVSDVDRERQAEDEQVDRLLRRYPNLTRSDALARVREQAQYRTSRR